MAKFTERSLADNQTWSIKQSINQSGLDFVLSESPYSISVKILKRFLQDRSQEISPPQTLESNPATFPLSPLLITMNPNLREWNKILTDLKS